MGKRILKKMLIALLTMYAVITISFLMVRFMPGDPLMHLVGQDTYYDMMRDSPAELELIAEKYGLNGTIWEQCWECWPAGSRAGCLTGSSRR